MSQPSPTYYEIELDAARAMYEHLRAVYKDDEESRAAYVEKIHRLMTVQAILFASMAYGLERIDWAKESVWVYILGGLALVGGVALVVGFGIGIHCIRVRHIETVGVDRLSRALNQPSVRNLAAPGAFQDLADNIARAISKNRERGKHDPEYGVWTARCTLIGFVFVVLFVSFAVFGSVTTSRAAQKENRVSTEPATPSQSSTSPNQTPTPAASPVAPSDSNTPSQPQPVGEAPSLREPTQWVAGSANFRLPPGARRLLGQKSDS